MNNLPWNVWYGTGIIVGALCHYLGIKIINYFKIKQNEK